MKTAPRDASRPPSLRSVLNNLQAYLEYERDEGVTCMDADPATVAELGKAPPRPVNAEPELRRIAAEVAACRRCGLHKTRTRTVPGQGSPRPEIMFVGEGPGAEEDEQGMAFVGDAGQLLTRMIGAMGFTREQVFIANIVKCRPPANRTPLPEEMAACLPYLQRQIALLQPRVIVALGGTAVRGLLQIDTGITRLRGQWCTYEEIPVMPTFHPSYLLRDEGAKYKRDVWNDLQAVLKRIGREPPPRKKSAE